MISRRSLFSAIGAVAVSFGAASLLPKPSKRSDFKVGDRVRHVHIQGGGTVIDTDGFVEVRWDGLPPKWQVDSGLKFHRGAYGDGWFQLFPYHLYKAIA